MKDCDDDDDDDEDEDEDEDPVGVVLHSSDVNDDSVSYTTAKENSRDDSDTDNVNNGSPPKRKKYSSPLGRV